MRAPPFVVASLVFAAACSPAAGPASAPAGAASRWVGTWTAAPQPAMPGGVASFQDQSVRLVVHASVGGSAVRVHVANTFGDRPLVIGAARVARRAAGAAIDPASDRPLTFGGQPSVTVAAGATVASDPARLEVPALSDLAVSLFLPGAATATTSHFLAMQTSYVSPPGADATASVAFPVAKTLDAWPFLTGVDVAAAPAAYSIVAFGDSTVDGDGSTPDTNHRWPDVLAARLHADGRAIGVLNEGLIGNRLLVGSPNQPGSPFGAALGVAAVERFDRDALDQPGVRCVVVRVGMNDLGLPGSLAPVTEAATAEGLIAGYRQLAARAHARRIRIVGTTIAPFEDAAVAPGYASPAKEVVRQQVNAWIRGTRDFDAVVDVDALVKDPGHPARLLPRFDSGDHLHTNDEGYAATAEAVEKAVIEVMR